MTAARPEVSEEHRQISDAGMEHRSTRHLTDHRVLTAGEHGQIEDRPLSIRRRLYLLEAQYSRFRFARAEAFQRPVCNFGLAGTNVRRKRVEMTQMLADR